MTGRLEQIALGENPQGCVINLRKATYLLRQSYTYALLEQVRKGGLPPLAFDLN